MRRTVRHKSRPVAVRRRAKAPAATRASAAGAPDRLSPAPAGKALRRDAVIRLQQITGNQHVARYVEYNAADNDRRDPEVARGVLPFTDGGWDGLAIGREVSQLNLADRTGPFRCVEASFLVMVIQRGPGALRTLIENYLRRYNYGISQESTPEAIKAWYQRAAARLAPMLGRIDDQTLTFNDLSTLQRAMYDVYGEASRGTQWQIGNFMARREGYEIEVLNIDAADRLDLVDVAADLAPGQILSCRIHATRAGTGEYNHAVHLGRHPDTGQYYFYDPLPVRGDQLITCGADLSEITHYFDNEDTVTLEDGTTEETIEARTFNIYAKLTPPAAEAEGG